MSGVAVVLACYALVALMLAASRWLAGRRLAAVGHVLLAAGSACGAALLWPLAADLATYAPLLPSQPVADLRFEQTGARRFRATLTRLPDGRMQVLEMPGDQWRIDARTLAWDDRVTRLGLGPLYRIDRISTRDTRPAGTSDATAADFSLSDDVGMGIWAHARTAGLWQHLAQARQAYGPWRPMAQGARFEVRMRGASVEVGPANAAAEAAMRARR